MDATVMLPFVNPATGQQFGEVPMNSCESVEQAMRELRAAQPAWSGKPLRERIKILREFQKFLINSQDEITAVLNEDCGKSKQDALIELFITVDMLAQYCKHAPQLLKRQRVSSGLYFFKQ